jgi:methionyl aminopeptidase
MFEAQPTALPGRNDPCHCGSGKKYKLCHLRKDQAAAPSTARVKRPAPVMGLEPAAGGRGARAATLIKTPEQIAGIRKAGSLARQLLDLLDERIRPGATTEDIDRWVRDATAAAGAVCAPLNYKGFPKSVCTSVNEVVCHGIPEERVLVEGDIVNVDVTPILGGYYGDSSRMYEVGRVSAEAHRLVEVTRECLDLGIRQVRPGGHVGDIGQAIQAHAESNGFSVVRDFVGHGTGVIFHEEPQIPHFGRRGHGLPLRPGMVFTIEPMINAGDWPVRILADGWTAVTRDGSLSAQFEHTLLVTPDGVDVMTA